MPTTLQTDTVKDPSNESAEPSRRYARSMNIRGVPDHVWCRARTNAVESRMPLKEYVIRLLSESNPYPSN
jgi:predicted HicB family RNase H-like nuclease